MSHKCLRTILLSFSPLMLGSCSYGYDLLAVGIGGRLAFVVDPESSFKPDCIDGIQVLVDNGGPIAEPAPGDSKGLVQNGGAYWWKQTEVTSCENHFPIFYGQPIKGPPSIHRDGVPSGVEAKPLRIGVLYQISSSGDGAYGGGWFRILKSGRIENLRHDPTPPVVNADGYDVTDYANMAEPPDEGTYKP